MGKTVSLISRQIGIVERGEDQVFRGDDMIEVS